MLLICSGIDASQVTNGSERRPCSMCGVGILIAAASLRLMALDPGIKAVCLACGLWKINDSLSGGHLAQVADVSADLRHLRKPEYTVIDETAAWEFESWRVRRKSPTPDSRAATPEREGCTGLPIFSGAREK